MCVEAMPRHVLVGMPAPIHRCMSRNLLYTPANCTYQSASVPGADPGACVIDPDHLYTEASLAAVTNQTQLGRALSDAMVSHSDHGCA